MFLAGVTIVAALDVDPAWVAVPFVLKHVVEVVGIRSWTDAFAPDGEPARSGPEWLGQVMTYLVALLMVSTFRYLSFKQVDFARRRPVGVLLVVVLAVLIVATHPQWFLFLLFTAYVVSGPARPLWARRREVAALTERGSRDAH